MKWESDRKGIAGSKDHFRSLTGLLNNVGDIRLFATSEAARTARERRPARLFFLRNTSGGASGMMRISLKSVDYYFLKSRLKSSEKRM